MPKAYVVKFDAGGAGLISCIGAYDDGTNYHAFSFDQPVNVANPIKNQIDKAAIADHVNTVILGPGSGLPQISSGDVELLT